jgi:hypothetical protein
MCMISLIQAELQCKLPDRQAPYLDYLYPLEQVELGQGRIPENQHEKDAET